jgi:hypothetical protein
MNRDDIIRMAREAEGIQFNYRPSEEFVYFAERFAALVAQHLSYDGIHTCHAECQRPACVAVREAVKAEREACAQIAFNAKTYLEATAAIRSRGER